MIPCKGCIVFSICQNKERLVCELLYNYLCISKKDFVNYRRGSRRAQKVFDTFGKYIMSTNYGMQSIAFTTYGEVQYPPYDDPKNSHSEK